MAKDKVTVSLDPDVHDALKKASERQRLPKSILVNQVLAKHFAKLVDEDSDESR